MKFSLELLRERLGSLGERAVLVDDDGRRLSKIRLAQEGMGQTMPDALYVADGLPEGCAVGPECAFVFTRPPAWPCAAPYLLLPDELALPEALNEVTGAIDSLGAVLEEVDALTWQEDGLQRIAEKIEQLCGNPCYLVDSSFKVMAITDNPEMVEMSINWMHAAKYGYLSYDLIANLIRSNELYDLESSSAATIIHSNYFYVPFINYNLRQSGRVQGHLFVIDMFRHITPGDLEIVDLVAPYALRAMLNSPLFRQYSGSYYEHFVADWLEGRIQDPVYMQRQLDALAFKESAHPLVATFRMSSRNEFRTERLARLLEDWQGCMALAHGSGIVAIFQLKDRSSKAAAIERMRKICRDEQCRAAVSDVQDEYHDIPRGYRQTVETLRICDAMGLEDSVVSYGDVAAFQPYLNFASAAELDDFLHPAITFLQQYDREHAVQLLPTLAEFLKNDRDVQKTAAKLFVHRNTLTYRMKRILELCPVDLDDFGTRQRLLESILIVEHYDRIAKSIKD